LNVFWRGVEIGRRRGQDSESYSGIWRDVVGLMAHVQIAVAFSQRIEKKSWFTVGEELVPWEKWCALNSPTTRGSRRLRKAVHLGSAGG
jgi:hypothetical protein